MSVRRLIASSSLVLSTLILGATPAWPAAAPATHGSNGGNANGGTATGGNADSSSGSSSTADSTGGSGGDAKSGGGGVSGHPKPQKKKKCQRDGIPNNCKKTKSSKSTKTR